MRTIQTSQGSFKISDSIKELPIHRFSEFQKYLLQDSGIGSTIEEVYKHSEKLDIFLAANKVQEAINERANQHFNFFYMLNQISITHLTFAVFVDAIDDQPVTDHSESNLRQVCDRLGRVNGLQRQELETILEDIKKKLIPN